MSMSDNEVTVDHETIYSPSADVVARARIQDWDALSNAAADNPEQFWADRANELAWYKKWDSVLDSANAPYYK